MEQAGQLEGGEDGERGVGQVQVLQLLHHGREGGRRKDLDERNRFNALHAKIAEINKSCSSAN